MTMKRIILSLALIGALAACEEETTQTTPEPSDQAQQQQPPATGTPTQDSPLVPDVLEANQRPVTSVETVTLCVAGQTCGTRGQVPQGEIWILAQGQVNSGGWTDPELVRIAPDTTPPDGIYEFNFVADPPDQAGTQAMTPIEAVYEMDEVPQGFTGVRVRAQQNNAEARRQ